MKNKIKVKSSTTKKAILTGKVNQAAQALTRAKHLRPKGLRRILKQMKAQSRLRKERQISQASLRMRTMMRRTGMRQLTFLSVRQWTKI